MKHTLYILLVATLLFPYSSFAASSKKAETLYENGQYQEALDAYFTLAQKGQSAKLYYNIGNCYFRMDSIPQALLWFERAYLLDPSDADIRYNLNYARSKTIDKIVPEEDMFFVRWYHGLLNTLSVQGWTIAGILLFSLCLASLCAYIFLSEVRLRKMGFYGAIVLFVMVILSNIFAWQQRSLQFDHNRGIILSSSVSCKSSPNEAGKELYLLHEGTSVSIIDRSVRNWLEIRLSDGKQGWIPASSIEVI